MKMQHLREFILFSEYVNFTIAAKKLFISQPALSNHIATLERELGVSLVNRGEMPSLTRVGRVFLNDAIALVRLHDEAIHRCQTLGSQGEATVTIAMDELSTTAAGENFSMFYHKFREAFPETYVKYCNCPEPNASRVLRKRDIDCVLVPYTEIVEDIKEGIVFEDIPNYSEGVLCIWAHKSHPLAAKQSLRWDDIQCIKHPFLIETSKVWSAAVRNLLTKHGVFFESRYVAEQGENFLYVIGDDEVQLFDSGMNSGYVRQMSSRTLIPLEGESAQVSCFIAYREDNQNPTFWNMLEFLHKCRAEYKAEKQGAAE